MFADRLILKARDPIDDVTKARIEKLCGGPLPKELLELWSVSFGGALDYDVPVRFGDHVASFSLRELFFPGSSHYRDLFGWIEAQLEVEEEENGPSDSIRYLPIGGFEYLDRLYVQVAPGENHGSVLLWMRGLPPAWRLRLHEDSVARVAPDPLSFFSQLVLEDDPFSAEDEYASGREMVERVLDIAEEDLPTGEKLQELVRGAILDWRGAVEDGSVAGDPALRRLALAHVASGDDTAMLARLLELGCDPEERYRGGGALVDHALARGSLAVVRALLERDVAVGETLKNGANQIDLALAEELLSRSAAVDARAVILAAGGDEAVALHLADVLFERNREEARAALNRANETAKREEKASARFDGDPARLELAERLRAVADHLDQRFKSRW